MRKADQDDVSHTANCTAINVAGDEDVLDAQVANSVLDHSMGVEIGGRDHIADVAVDEDFARTKTHDLVGRNSAISASEVEVLRLLRTSDSLCDEMKLNEGCLQWSITEVFRVLGLLGLNPLLVVLKDGGQIIASYMVHNQIQNFKLKSMYLEQHC